MAKRLDAPYMLGARTYDWIKLKRHLAGHLPDTLDCVVIGESHGQGQRASLGVGALLVAVYDAERDVLTSVTKIGTGLTEYEWRAVRARGKAGAGREPGGPGRLGGAGSDRRGPRRRDHALAALYRGSGRRPARVCAALPTARRTPHR